VKMDNSIKPVTFRFFAWFYVTLIAVLATLLQMSTDDKNFLAVLNVLALSAAAYKITKLQFYKKK